MNKMHPHDDIKPFAGSEKGKKDQVAEMFNDIAGGYDKVNRVLSGGTDVGWRKKALSFLKKENPIYILDVATGTADMAILACRMIPNVKIAGIDISQNMLDLGQKKIEKEGLDSRIHLQRGDSETINYGENTFDAVMVAFGVRNFENLEKGLAEMLRVLKPGGRLVVLEFSQPRRKLVKRFYRIYMNVIAPKVAGWFKQNRQAYQYLNESAHAFPDRELFTGILNKTGYTETDFKPLSLGICCIYTGRKPER
jgi:demethylmenaquinone methyltransferase / 2-methoxy-6-polyprenyl-1,4-benzoquinol methylase